MVVVQRKNRQEAMLYMKIFLQQLQFGLNYHYSGQNLHKEYQDKYLARLPYALRDY